jgi:hypothetical protein
MYGPKDQFLTTQQTIKVISDNSQKDNQNPSGKKDLPSWKSNQEKNKIDPKLDTMQKCMKKQKQ